MNIKSLDPLAHKAAGERRLTEFSIIDPLNERDRWLELRKRDVTASVAGALFGVHDFVTPYQLWALKSGLIEDNIVETAAMRRGRLLEPVAIRLLREERPTWRVEPCSTYFRDPHARIGATPDALAVDPERTGFGIVQIKSVEQSAFRRKWRNDSGEVEPPLWIAVQALVEANLTGADWAVIAALTVSFGADIHVVEVPFNAAIWEQLNTRVAEFWRCVETKEPPPLDYQRDGEALTKIYAGDNGETVDLTGWNRGTEIATLDAMLKAEISEKDKARKAIKAELLEKMGNAAIAVMDGKTFATARTVNRKSFTVAETNYRDVRFK
jgi:predicted phage-related endonuclease